MKRVIKNFVVGMMMVVGMSSYASPSLVNNIPDGGSKYGKDSAKCVTNLSLYSDYYKQWRASGYKNNDLAATTYQYWRYCFLNCPIASQNVYSRGVRLVTFKIKTTKDSIARESYIDTLMMVYNNRIKYFPNNPKYPVGYLKGRQAVDLYKYRKNAPEQYYPIFKESFDLMGTKSEPTVLYGYYIATVKYWKDKHCDIDLVYTTYMEIYDVLQYNIRTLDEKKAKKYEAVSNNIEKTMVKLAKCEKLVSVFEPKFDANPNDTILARNLVRLFEMRSCTKNDLYFKALEQVHKIAPSAESAFSMGRLSMRRELYDKAKGYLLQAAELTPDSLADRKAKIYLLLAEDYKKLGQKQKSREAALKVLNYSPDNPAVYMLIGELYVKSANDCKFKGMTVAYWPAADKFAKAAAVAKDEKIKQEALKQLAIIKKNFPLQQDVFMRNLKEGDTFKVECWINETTTVRIRK
jgi:tetratricopeptide (TPR) repeat protein